MKDPGEYTTNWTALVYLQDLPVGLSCSACFTGWAVHAPTNLAVCMVASSDGQDEAAPFDGRALGD